MIQAIRREEQRQGSRVRRGGDLAQELPDQAADGSLGGLSGQVGRVSERVEAGREPDGLAGGAGPVDALDGDEGSPGVAQGAFPMGRSV